MCEVNIYLAILAGQEGFLLEYLREKIKDVVLHRKHRILKIKLGSTSSEKVFEL